MRMTSKLRKRGLAMFMALVLCLSLVQVTAFAEDGTITGEGGTQTEDDIQTGNNNQLADNTHEHTYSETVQAPTCTEPGKTVYTCECGDTYEVEGDPATGHTPVTDARVEPTETETGLTEGSHCSVCNAVLMAREVIPATGKVEPEIPEAVQAFLNAVEALPGISEITPDNAESTRTQADAAFALYYDRGFSAYWELPNIVSALAVAEAVYERATELAPKPKGNRVMARDDSPQVVLAVISDSLEKGIPGGITLVEKTDRKFVYLHPTEGGYEASTEIVCFGTQNSVFAEKIPSRIVDQSGEKIKQVMRLEEGDWNHKLLAALVPYSDEIGYVDFENMEKYGSYITNPSRLTQDNINDCEIVPYIVEFNPSENCWHVNCVVLPRDLAKRHYELQLPEGVSLQNENQFRLPDIIFGISYPQGSAWSSQNTNYIYVRPLQYQDNTGKLVAVQMNQPLNEVAATYRGEPVRLEFDRWRSEHGNSKITMWDSNEFIHYPVWLMRSRFYTEFYKSDKNSSYAQDGQKTESWSRITDTNGTVIGTMTFRNAINPAKFDQSYRNKYASENLTYYGYAINDGEIVKGDPFDAVLNPEDTIKLYYSESDWPVVLTIVTNMPKEGIPGEPAHIWGRSFFYTKYDESSQRYVAENNNWSYEIGTVSSIFGDVDLASLCSKSVVEGDQTIGIFDQTAVQTKRLMTGLDEEKLDRILKEALCGKGIEIDTSGGTLTTENAGDYEIVPYVIKTDLNNGPGGSGDKRWHIDCAVLPKNRIQLSYVLNLPEGVTAASSTKLTIPSGRYCSAGETLTGTVEFVKNGDTGLTPNQDQIDGILTDKGGNKMNIKLVFTGWKDAAGKDYTPGSQYSITQTNELKGQWKIVGGQYTVEWYKENENGGYDRAKTSARDLNSIEQVTANDIGFDRNEFSAAPTGGWSYCGYRVNDGELDEHEPKLVNVNAGDTIKLYYGQGPASTNVFIAIRRQNGIPDEPALVGDGNFVRVNDVYRINQHGFYDENDDRGHCRQLKATQVFWRYEIFCSEGVYVEENVPDVWIPDEQQCPCKGVPASGSAWLHLVPEGSSKTAPGASRLYGFDWTFCNI